MLHAGVLWSPLRMSQASERWTETRAITTEREKNTSGFRNMEGWCWGETAQVEEGRGTSWGFRQVPFPGMRRSWSQRCRAQVGSCLAWHKEVEGRGRSGTPQCKKRAQGLARPGNVQERGCRYWLGGEGKISYPAILMLGGVCVCVYKRVWYRCVILCGGPRLLSHLVLLRQGALLGSLSRESYLSICLGIATPTQHLPGFWGPYPNSSALVCEVSALTTEKPPQNRDHENSNWSG